VYIGLVVVDAVVTRVVSFKVGETHKVQRSAYIPLLRLLLSRITSLRLVIIFYLRIIHHYYRYTRPTLLPPITVCIPH